MTDTSLNQHFWDGASDAYQARHGNQLAPGAVWGVWSLPEAEVQALGDVAGLDVLELGCGAAQWAIHLARKGARCTAIDLSKRQLTHATANVAAAGVSVRLLHADAEALPFAAASFDLVCCDHGAMTFADPYKTVPEAARVLRQGGQLVFSSSTPIRELCVMPDWSLGQTLSVDYFGLHRLVDDETVQYQLPYGDWIRLFRANGFIVEDLIELQPPRDASTSYEGYASLEWARRWPAEHIWRVRKLGA